MFNPVVTQLILAVVYGIHALIVIYFVVFGETYRIILSTIHLSHLILKTICILLQTLLIIMICLTFQLDTDGVYCFTERWIVVLKKNLFLLFYTVDLKEVYESVDFSLWCTSLRCWTLTPRYLYCHILLLNIIVTLHQRMFFIFNTQSLRQVFKLLKFS